MSNRCADDELFYSSIDFKSRADKADADTSSCSDTDGFERLSIPDSELVSDDEIVTDAARCGYLLNVADMNPSPDAAQIVPFTFQVQKPPTLPSPFERTEVCCQSLSSGRIERSHVFNNLVAIANNVDQMMDAEIKSEVEERMRLERAEFERQKTEYEQRIFDLQKECRQSPAEPEKSRGCCSYQYHDQSDQEHLSLQATCHQLRQEVARWSDRCAKREREITMLQQQAAESNRQMKENEDELYHLRSMFSEARVPVRQQQRPTFEIVDHSSVVPAEPLPTTSCASACPPDVWSCPRCTYDNLPSVKKCEMCDAPQTLGRTLEC